MATLFSVSWTYKYYMGSLLFIPLNRLELISFSTHLATSVAMATLFLFLGLKSLSWCSLHSKPLHGLVLISFSLMPGNKCCHGNTFFLFLTYKYFYGFFVFHTPAQISADKFFVNTFFFCFYVVDIKSHEEDLYSKVT